MTRVRGRLQRLRARHERAGVLVDHVVGIERDEQDRADTKGIPAPLKTRAVVVRQLVPGQVRVEPLRPVAELHFVVARQGIHGRLAADAWLLWPKSRHTSGWTA